MTRSEGAARIAFDDALAAVEAALHGDARRQMLERFSAANDPFAALRKAMRSHTWPLASGALDLRRPVDALDGRTRREGMHVLQGWDFVAHRFAGDIAPVLLLDFCLRTRIPDSRREASLAILLDQYFLALLALLAVRAWDEGDPNANLDRVGGALADLQGDNGCGHPFVGDAETLLMLAVSYYHPEEIGYDLLVTRAAGLDDAHRLRFARACAAMLGSHLRWGLRFMYERDVGRMRADNTADYPLLVFTVFTLARAFQPDDAGGVSESLLDALSADPWAFTGSLPATHAGNPEWHREARAFVADRTDDLLGVFTRFQPSPSAYSPLGFACNFPTNATVAMAVTAVHNAIPRLPLNALFTRDPEGTAPARSALTLAQHLMQFAVADPSRLGARESPLIVYDPYDGARAFNATMRTIRAGR